MGSALKLYVDLMSQPSRALYILLNAVKCPFEPHFVDLRKGAHFSEGYTTKVNRFQKVPVIDHNGFILTESVAILKYLSNAGIIPDTLYPKEIKSQARLEEFLEWQHIGLRLHLSMFFRVKYMDPILAGVEPDAKKVRAFESRMLQALDTLENKWLGRHRFLVCEHATVADVLCACEVEQTRMAGYDAAEHYPNIARWMTAVREHFNPHYDNAHVTLNKVVKKYQQRFGAASKL